MSEPKSHTLDVPGATLHYDVREPDGDSSAPPLLLIASPMDARGFATPPATSPTARSSPTTRGASRAASGPTARRRPRPRSMATTCTA